MFECSDGKVCFRVNVWTQQHGMVQTTTFSPRLSWRVEGHT